jgi:hypothetical protein
MSTDATQTDDTGDARVWRDQGWTARIIKNEDDDGWAVTMTRDGDAEPALTSPWTMGRDKKNPKPLNTTDFRTLLKGARDVLTRHEAHARAQRHKSISLPDASGALIRIDLDVAADEDDPHAILSAWDPSGEKIAERRVAANFGLGTNSARRWISSGFADP